MNLRKGHPAAVAAVAVAAALFVACSSGETTVTAMLPTQTGVSVSATGSVTTIPDIAVLNIGIEVTRDTIAEARAEAAQTANALRDSLLADGVEERDIATQYFNIYPRYSSPPPCEKPGPCPSSQPTISGFTVNNQIVVRVRDIDATSTVLDNAIEAGGDAVRVNGVSFAVDEPERYFDDARRLAMEDARERAEQLANLAGRTLGGMRSVSESSGGRTNLDFMPQPAPAPGGVSTSLSPGEATISLSVQVVYELE